MAVRICRRPVEIAGTFTYSRRSSGMTTSAKARNIAINSGTFTKLAKRLSATGFVCKVLQKERVHRALEADMEAMRIIAEGGHVIVTD